MRHKAADLSLSIKIVTSLVLLLMVAFLIGSIFQRALLIPAALLFIISAFCYIYAPVGYGIGEVGY
jgi:glucan phosphoethanolaminetransferase (alkaline phosphatase superfamily)